MRDQIQWVAPSPLWAAATIDASARESLRRPVVLRFATDTFMDDFLRVLDTDPSRLGGYLAQPETWRGPSPQPEATEEGPRFLRRLSRARLAANRALDKTSPQTLATQRALVNGASGSTTAPLKLYQPAHQRFYLVTACLVCRTPGLPDHAIDRNREEAVGYVVRRLFRKEGAQTSDEYAFVATPRGNGWQKVAGMAATTLVEGEERLPLFPANFTDTDGRGRRLYAGMIPVGKREAYMGAGEHTPATSNGATPKTARKIHFRMQIAEPWKSLLERAAAALRPVTDSKGDDAPQPEDTRTLVKDSREQMQTMSWYILLDMSKYLVQYLPNVWAVVAGQKPESQLANDAERNLYNALRDTTVSQSLRAALTDPNDPNKSPLYTPSSVAASLLVALQKISDPAKNRGDKLEQVAVSYDRKNPDALWPDFLFPLADLSEEPPLPPAQIAAPDAADESGEAVALDPSGIPASVQAQQARVDKLVALIVRALPVESSEPAPALPLASQPLLDMREGQFIIRCVFERPLCGPLDPPVLSEPTDTFQLAGFFDPDAPARPIRIALPIDTTPAGLRKFDKNTVFMISDALCGQIQRMKGITFGDLVLSVLPWPFHKDLSSKVPKMEPCRTDGGIELGMMCTLSIPIITICALILLMIIVLLFDFIFKWVPLFIMCFPLPKFKSKG
ncbi:MAG: hypothetical protein WCD76_06930 [Pyrinomonadaceae bacterium]